VTRAEGARVPFLPPPPRRVACEGGGPLKTKKHGKKQAEAEIIGF